MRKLTLVLVATLAAALPSVSVAAPGQGKPPKPRAELVTKKVTASLATTTVTAGGSVKNKGDKKAPASQATFYLSADTKLDRDDTPLGSAAVAAVKPKKSKPVAGSFAVPAGVTAGTFHVVICADAGGAVRERKETNNCKGSKGTITITGVTNPGGSVTVSATATPVAGGTVASSAVTGGACVANGCTFTAAGTGTVTFTPTVNAGYRFGAWGGATCTGFTAAAGNKITFTNPTTNKACTATFVKQVTVNFSEPLAELAGQVRGSTVGGGSCTQPNSVTGMGGSCVVDATTGTVVLQASNALLNFSGWGGDCTGSANPLVLTNLTADKTCTATFGP